MGNMIDVLTDQMDKIASSAVESAPFDKGTHGRIIEVLDGNKYTVKLSDGTEKSVLSLTSDSFVKDDVVVVSALQNDSKNSYIIGKPGISKISVTGYGDMSKSTYDTDNDGIVDNAEKVNGHTVLTDVPTGAVFTDTTYVDATTSAHGLMSSADKTKLDGIASGANKNVNTDWNATSGDAQILNKPSTFAPSAHTHTKSDITDFPTIPSKLSDLSDDTTHRVVTDTEKSTWSGKQNATDTLTSETALSDSDEFPFYDTSATGNRKTLWSNIKSVLKTYFDGLYAAISHTHTKSQITDFPTIPDQLSDLADDSTHRVVTDTEISTWNSKQSALSGDVTSHYHSSDRNRANHTGTQTASTISDFASAALSAAPAETVTSVGTIVNGATAKTAPVNADMIPLMDSADSNKIKKLSWAYVKSVLNTYFSSIFAAKSHTHTASNISDLTATAAELNFTDGVTSNIQTQLNTKAPIASPAFTGIVTAPTFSGTLNGNAVSASKAGLLTGLDTRSVNSAPSEYMSGGSLYLASMSSKVEFKGISTLGITSLTGTYCYLITHTPWTDSSGGYPIQVAYGNGYPCWRVGTSGTTWGSWNTLNSGGNADKLDGQEGSYYLDYSNATNKPSPVITLSGDASGSATLTGLSSATLNVAIADDSHNHVINNVDGLQSALDSKLNTSLLGIANGVAQLDANGFVPASQLPSYVDDILEYNGIVNFPATGESGKIYVDTLTNLTYRWSGSSYTEISKSLALGETSSTAYAGNKGKAVTDGLASHKNNVSNPHGVTASQVGLGAFETKATNIKMNGTQSVGTLSTVARSDHVHPIDTSRAAASHTHTESNITNLTTDLAAKAPLASPAFTGVPTAPTATAGTNTTQIATTAFVQSAVSSNSGGTTIVTSSSQPSSQAVNDLWFAVI